MRLLYLGSGEFGLPTLEVLHQQHEMAAIVTQPDRPAGRKRQLTPTPVAQWAGQHDVPTLKTENVNTEAFIDQVRRCQVDAAIIIAFGQKLSPRLIDALGKLAVNLHASLLPKYRGAAPINWAIIRGEQTTGVSVIGLAQQMDGGDIYATASLTIDPLETAGELHDRLAKLGPKVIGKTLGDLAADTLSAQPQDDSKATRAPKLSKADGTVDVSQSAFAVRARINGLTPWPGCCVNWHCQATGKAQRLFLRRAAAGGGAGGGGEPDTSCFPGLEQAEPPPAPGTVLDDGYIAVGDGVVRLLEVQSPAARCAPIADFIRGHRFAAGDRLDVLSNEGMPINRGAGSDA